MVRFGSWFFVLAALSLALLPGCRKDTTAGAQPKPNAVEAPTPQRTAAELIRAAHNALAVAPGMPAPLSLTSARKDRQEYLQGMEQPLALLLDLPNSEGREQPFEDEVPPDLFERCADLFAVELADAIDRDQPDRASQALVAAFAYADRIGTRSVSQWVRANGLADRLCVGIRSVAPQVDEQMAQQINETLRQIADWKVDPKPAIEFSKRRIEEWRNQEIAATPVDKLLTTYGTSLNGRQVLSQELANKIRGFAKKLGDSQTLAAAALQAERDLAADAVLSFLNAAQQDPTVVLQLPDAAQHPIALLFVLYFRSDMEMAPRLIPLRLESIRLVSLTARILATGLPKDLTPFGEDAVSPVTNLAFGYKVEGQSFELVRPR